MLWGSGSWEVLKSFHRECTIPHAEFSEKLQQSPITKITGSRIKRNSDYKLAF
jgi:hypothetical protein